MTYRELLDEAIRARDDSYSPYSGIAVGAALLCEDGTVYRGANIENAAFTPTVCAERVAFFKAISDGQRAFSAIAIVGAKHGEAPVSSFPPCGVCRQVMAEFCSPDFTVVLSEGGELRCFKLSELLPEGFGPSNI